MGREFDLPVETLRKAAALGFGGIYVKDDVGGSALTRLDATIILRGAGAGLHLDRRLYLDPQHGGLDDRCVRRRAAAPSASCPKLCTMEHFASYCLTEPDSARMPRA
jgi:alkylation response protein AidB-like acyl-CoA dehydrogenase